MFTKYVLAVLLVNPVTHVESTKFELAETENTCWAKVSFLTDPNTDGMRSKYNGFKVKGARCRPIDLSDHAFKKVK